MNKQIELEKLAAEFGTIDVLTIAKDTNEQIATVMLKNENPSEEEIVGIMEELRNALPDNEKIMDIVCTTPLLEQDGPMRPYFFDATSEILAKCVNPTERMLAVVDSFADAYAKAKFFFGYRIYGGSTWFGSYTSPCKNGYVAPHCCVDSIRKTNGFVFHFERA